MFIDGDSAIVIDAGSGDLVTDTLEREGISDITALIISHRHHDHTSELPALLANRDLRIRRLFVNSDPNRKPESTFEKQLTGALNDAWDRNQTEYQQANVTLGQHMRTENLDVTVLWPNIGAAVTGVGASTPAGGTVHPHAVAVVVRVAHVKGRSILFGADLDHAGFRTLIDVGGTGLQSDVLVYPHHGGKVGAGSESGEEQFATDLTRAVNPEVVLFSNGRGQYGNPRREVVRGVRQARDSPKVRLICTQLSELCSAAAVPDQGRLDTSIRSAGGPTGASCSGSLRIDLLGTGPLVPGGHKHLDFVINHVGDGALCIRAS